MEQEVWVDIPNCISYQISDHGKVRTIGRVVPNSKTGTRFVAPKQLVLCNNGHGYLVAPIQIERKKKNHYIHRLVAQVFIPNPQNLPEVNHIDGNKSNNHFKNLEWVSIEQNRKHAVENDLMCFGEKNHKAKLTKKEVKKILLEFRFNPTLNKRALSRKYGVTDSTIHKIIKGNRWKKLHKSLQ